MNGLLESMFPPAPSAKGNWFAIYMEPVIGCGERITIAVAAVTSEKKSKVTQAIHTDVLECIYGSQAYKLQSQVSWIIESASQHLELNQCLSNWEPPLSGIHTGSKRKCEANDLEGMLRQAIEFSASLNNLTTSKDNKSSSPNHGLGYFAKNVKEIVLEKQPLYRGYFNVEAEIIQHNKERTRFGFLNDSYAANIASINAAGITNSFNSAKAKILELHALQSTQDYSHISNYELILGVPEKDVTISDATLGNIYKQARLLKDLADQQAVQVISSNSVDEAAEHLLEMAA